MKNLSNVIRSRAARFVSLRVALVLCAVMVFAGLGVAPAWNGGFEWLSMRKASAQNKAASAREAAGQAQEPGITLGTSYHSDTSPRLRDMVQVPVMQNEVGFGQSINAPEAITARGTDSGAIGVAGISPDTNGEVGATQRVKIVKKGYQVFDNLTGTSVLGPSDISTIWAGFGGSCETGGAGDAVVLYDKLADRWVISQFGSATGGKAVTEECFAVSTTSDATGSYYRYAFHLSTNFIDSPHLSVEADGYLMGDSVYNESGTERLGNQFFVFDRTAMLTGAAATFTSPGIDTGVGETYSISADGVRLASGPGSLAVTTLTINLTYASDATFTSAGLSATDIVNMKAANTFAASQLTNNFRDPINLNILVTAVPGTGTLGKSNWFLTPTPFATGIRDSTRADATSADDATMSGAGGSVPAGLADPIGGTHTWWVTKAQGKALRIAADDLTNDGTYTFGGGQPYTYDPNNRAVAGKYDYIGVTMHEFSEIMGRVPGLGTTSFNGSPGYLQMDLFHYTAANTRGLTSGAGRFFSFNNGTTLLKAFNNAVVDPGTDPQDWASGTNDSFNARSNPGVKNDLTAVDLQVMDVIGYDRATSCSGTKAVITSPTPGSTFSSSSVTFTWNSGSNVTQYWLYLGNSPGAQDLYSASQGTNLSVTVNSIPTDGRTIYVTLWSYICGAWQSNPYSYHAFTVCSGGTKAVMQSPANGSTFGSSSVTFNWGGGSNVSQYWLYLGNSPGAQDIYSANQASNLSANVNGIPTDGRTIYVTLWSYICGAWQSNPYSYHAFTVCSGGTKAVMQSPANGSTFGSSSVTFNWGGGSNVSQYWLYLGNSPGAQDIYSANQASNLSANVNGIPTDGRTIYVTLWSYICGAWQSNAYSYHAFTVCSGGTKAVMQSPANGSTFASTTVTFIWTSGSNVGQYWLYIGNSPGAADLYSASQGTSTSVTLINFPTDGRAIYVTLWSYICGAWQFNSYSYHCVCSGTKAVMLSPPNGSTLFSSTVTFTWSSGANVAQYWLYIGNSPGAADLYSASQGTNTSVTLTGFPRDGRTIYVTLWSYVCGSWQSNSYFYFSF